MLDTINQWLQDNGYKTYTGHSPYTGHTITSISIHHNGVTYAKIICSPSEDQYNLYNLYPSPYDPHQPNTLLPIHLENPNIFHDLHQKLQQLQETIPTD